jgi:hypothetical protein
MGQGKLGIENKAHFRLEAGVVSWTRFIEVLIDMKAAAAIESLKVR